MPIFFNELPSCTGSAFKGPTKARTVSSDQEFRITRRVVSGSHISVKMQEVQVKVKIPLLLNSSHVISNLILIRLSSTPIIACSSLYSFLNSGQICEARVSKHSRLPSNLLVEFMLNLTPYTSADKKFLFTLTFRRLKHEGS